jgi:hypothetical protein
MSSSSYAINAINAINYPLLFLPGYLLVQGRRDTPHLGRRGAETTNSYALNAVNAINHAFALEPVRH